MCSQLAAHAAEWGDGLSTSPMLHRRRFGIWQAMNTANIAIYPVNVLGIGSGGSRTGGQQINGSYTASSNAGFADDPTFGIKMLADKTGGKWCTSMTEVKTCMDQAVQDSTALGAECRQHFVEDLAGTPVSWEGGPAIAQSTFHHFGNGFLAYGTILLQGFVFYAKQTFL